MKLEGSEDTLFNHMLKKEGIFFKSNLPSVWHDSNYTIYWEGLVFINGILSGAESINIFIKEIRKVGVENACCLLKGIFFILIKEKESNDFYAFVDNSGLYQAFYTNEFISTSFLKLVEHGRYQVSDLDPESIVEFLYFGNLFFNKTFFEPIRRISSDTIIHLTHHDKKIKILRKIIPSINMPLKNGIDSFYQIFEGLAKSLANKKISIDLTGGIDSRLIVLMLDYFGLEFETAISGGTNDYKDIKISEKVAKALKHPWYCTIHSLSSLEQDIPELFYATDGLYNILYFHRLFQLQKARLERGIDVMISGVGGEFFKDFWWLQDFPFYFKRSSNIKRLVDLRIMTFRTMDHIFTEKYTVLYRTLKNNIIEKLSQYLLETNTETYDNICFFFRMREVAGRELTNYSPYVKTYAPLLDLDVVRMGFMLPRKLRMYNIFHRKELSKLNSFVAKMPTTEGGISASSELVWIMCDLPKYLGEKTNRLLIKLNLQKQKQFTSLNHPNFYYYARELNIMKESIEILKEIGIINKKIDLGQIEDRCLGMVLSLGMLINYMNRNT